jgi:hypothetical protein
MALVAEGKAKVAVELLEKNALPDTLNDAGKEALQKKFAAMYGVGGKFVGQEVVGYRKYGSRLYRFYAVVHFEKAIVTLSYVFVKTTDQGWKITKLTVSDGVDELEKLVPFVPLGAARD